MDLVTGLGATAVEGVKAKYERKDRQDVMKKEDIVRDAHLSMDKEKHSISMDQEKLALRMKQLELEEKLQNSVSTSKTEDPSISNTREESKKELLDIEAKMIEAITENNVMVVAQMSKRGAGLDLDMLHAAHDIALGQGNKAIIRLTQMALDKKKKSLASDAVVGFKQASTTNKPIPPKCETVQKQTNPKQLSQKSLASDAVVGFKQASTTNKSIPSKCETVQKQANPKQLYQELVQGVRSSDAGAVGRALRQGGDPNATMTCISPHTGKTYTDVPLLSHAVIHQSLGVAKVLLAAPGIQVDKPGPNGHTALNEAVLQNHSAFVLLLLQRGPNPNLPSGSPDPRPPLFEAALKGNLPVCLGLLDRGADPNGTNPEGSTAMYAAANAGHKNIIELLMQHGGDPQHKNNDGKTPADTARIAKHKDLYKWLARQRKQSKQ